MRFPDVEHLDEIETELFKFYGCCTTGQGRDFSAVVFTEMRNPRNELCKLQRMLRLVHAAYAAGRMDEVNLSYNNWTSTVFNRHEG